MPQRSKFHHYVPQVLQRKFAAKEGWIWFAERGADGRYGPPHLKKIKKAFGRKNYNTVGTGDGLSDWVEKQHYGEIDGYLGELLPEVQTAFDCGQVPAFEGRALEALQRVVVEMQKRTPAFLPKRDDVEVGKQLIRETLSALDAKGWTAAVAATRTDLESPDRLRELGRNIRVRATMEHSERITNAMADFRPHWVRSNSSHSFILSSRMVYMAGNGGVAGLSNPNVEIWMPLFPKLSLVLIGRRHSRIPPEVVAPRDHIRRMNQYAASVSHEIASHSRKLLESITGKKAVEHNI